jgi:hypothetical protein
MEFYEELIRKTSLTEILEEAIRDNPEKNKIDHSKNFKENNPEKLLSCWDFVEIDDNSKVEENEYFLRKAKCRMEDNAELMKFLINGKRNLKICSISENFEHCNMPYFLIKDIRNKKWIYHCQRCGYRIDAGRVVIESNKIIF